MRKKASINGFKKSENGGQGGWGGVIQGRWENNVKGKIVGVKLGGMGTARNSQKSENGGNGVGWVGM